VTSWSAAFLGVTLLAMDPRLMEQRRLAKRRSGRIWATIAGVLWLVIVLGVVFQQDPGANIGAGLLAFAAIPATIVALAESSESRYSDPGRYRQGPPPATH
jgi:hypothetical protein